MKGKITFPDGVERDIRIVVNNSFDGYDILAEIKEGFVVSRNVLFGLKMNGKIFTSTTEPEIDFTSITEAKKHAFQLAMETWGDSK
jgi:hypothetical protein